MHKPSRGPGKLGEYTIHQLEPIVMLMGTDIRRVMFTGTEKGPAYVCEFSDGRRASVSHNSFDCPFITSVGFNDGSFKKLIIESDFFNGFIHDLVCFFRTKEASVPHEETVAIFAAQEAAKKAAAVPGCWIEV